MFGVSSSYPVHTRPGPMEFVPVSSLAGLRVVFLNVCCDMRAEDAPGLRFADRAPALTRYLLDSDADVIVLTEITRANLNTYIVPALASYELRSASRAPGVHEFAHAVFFRPQRVFPLHAEQRWMTPMMMLPGSSFRGDHHRGRLLLHVKFSPVRNDEDIRLHRVQQPIDCSSPPLHLIVVHFAVSEEAKTLQARFVSEYVRSILASDANASVIAVGDFNSFSSPVTQALTQRELLSVDGRLLDTSTSTVNRSDGAPTQFTFRPYPYESNYEHLLGLPRRFLDGVFVSRDKFTVRSATCVDDLRIGGTGASADLAPSDHFPLEVVLDWSSAGVR